MDLVGLLGIHPYDMQEALRKFAMTRGHSPALAMIDDKNLLHYYTS